MALAWTLVILGVLIAILGLLILANAAKLDRWFRLRHPSTTGRLQSELTTRMRQIGGFGLLAVGLLMALGGFISKR